MLRHRHHASRTIGVDIGTTAHTAREVRTLVGIRLPAFGRRGARPARREERAYREYVSDKQRCPAGCIGGQGGNPIPIRVLSVGAPAALPIPSWRDRERLYGKAGSGAGTPGASGVRAVLSNIATIV